MRDGFLHFTGADRIFFGWGKLHSFARAWEEVGYSKVLKLLSFNATKT